MGITIMLADDHKIVREGIRLLLEQEDDMEVIAQAENGVEALQLVKKYDPDVVVMDLTMPDLNGVETTRQIIADKPQAKVLALTMQTDRRFVVEALKSGAKGYLLKSCAFEELVGAVRTVYADEIHICQKIAELIIKDYMQRVPEALPLTFSDLSPREREVLQYIAAGKSTKEIAFYSGVSIKTVETQRQQIMKKLNLFSIAELTKYAVREGLTSLN